MSLLSEAMESFTIVDKRTVSDGMGGYSIEWVDGASIQAVAVKDASLQAQVAQKQGVTGIYTITTGKTISLQFHDVLRRNSDNMIFRVTSNGVDKATPASASLNMRQVSAEEWTLTNG